jgi:hypothetical protein
MYILFFTINSGMNFGKTFKENMDGAFYTNVKYQYPCEICEGPKESINRKYCSECLIKVKIEIKETLQRLEDEIENLKIELIRLSEMA